MATGFGTTQMTDRVLTTCVACEAEHTAAYADFETPEAHQENIDAWVKAHRFSCPKSSLRQP